MGLSKLGASGFGIAGLGLSSKVPDNKNPVPEPLKQVNADMSAADAAQRKKLALAKGLQSTWTRDYPGKAKTLGGA